MIILDANLLLLAHNELAVLHQEARVWLRDVLSGEELVGLPWQSIWAFLRIVTDRRLPTCLTLEKATEIADSWIRQPNVKVLAPGNEHWRLLRAIAIDGQARGPLFSDAQLAAVTMEYGGVLYTTDRDFARFPGLRWVNPLQ